MSIVVKKKIFFSIASPPQEIEWLKDIDPFLYIEKSKVKADIFTFWERVPFKKSKMTSFPFYELDQVAAISFVDFDFWWNKQIGKKTRNLVRKAKKKGVEIKVSSLNDDFVRGIERVYNETPIRQGKLFWHYGENFNQIKQEYQALEKYPHDYICAIFEGKIIGFLHLLYTKETALINQILSLQKHWDKAPNNALIAKAVELACSKGVQYLVYDRMIKGPLGDFKRNNGFKQMFVLRYYVPLSFKGKVIVSLKLQRGLQGLLPERLKDFLRRIRKLSTKGVPKWER